MPPYQRKLINEGETVVLDLKPHWWFFWRHIMVGSGLVVLFIIWVGPLDSNKWLGWPLGLGILMWVAWVVYRYFVWTYTHFVLTDKRVISRSGIISKRGTEIPLERINNIDFHQGLIDRVLGAGDLDIESAGRDGQTHFDFVRHPDLVQQEIYRQMETNARRQASWAHPPTPAPAPAPAAPVMAQPVQETDVTEQIAKLAALRDQGHITPEEYEAKKTELLGRI